MEALDKELIAGAGLDVFSIEPLPEKNPFIALKNILLTNFFEKNIDDTEKIFLEKFNINYNKKSIKIIK